VISIAAPLPAPETSPGPHYVPVGAMTAAAVASILAGALGAKLLYDAYPTAAVLLAPLLGLGVYALVRVVPNADGSPAVRAALAVSATVFTAFYFLSIAGERFQPVHSPDAGTRLVQALVFLARALFSAALPVMIASVAAWQALGEGRRSVRPGALAPVVVAVGLGTAAFAVSMAIFIGSMAVLPRDRLPFVMVGMLLVMPIIVHGVWTYLFGVVLARWEVDAPDALGRALAALRSRCGFTFDRVICLDGSYGNGRVAGVTSTVRSSTLLISEPLTSLLDPEELVAILAHETAHLELRHFRRKLLFGLPVAVITLGLYVALSAALAPMVPRNVRIVQFMCIGMFTGFIRHLYDRFVTRRHECEADAYAARAVGAATLLRALEKLGAARSPITTANVWTTHSTWEIRSNRLRELAEREGDP
jgi:Zn-dependent protease with chaperone function